MIIKKSLLICTSPRSGSNWLCDLLNRTEHAGRPEEYFNRLVQYAYEKMLDQFLSSNYSALFDAIVRRGTTRNGIFASKLFWHDLDYVKERLGADIFPGQDGLGILSTLLPNLHIVRLMRKNHLRQAISHYRASTTGIWWNIREAATSSVPQHHYDYEGISASLKRLDACAAGWDAALAGFQGPIMTVDYEELVASTAETFGRILDFLNLEHREEWLVCDASFMVQADAMTDHWERRFLSEQALRKRPVEAEDTETPFSALAGSLL